MSDPDGFYKILGVPPKSDYKTIKQAYYKLLKEYHPDNSRRANEIKKIKDDEEREKKLKELEKFCAEINEAQKYLEDEENKRRYDQGIGKDGPKMDASNIFDFFGMGQQQRRRKVKDTVYNVEVTLKDAFVGIKKKYKINRSVICKGCDGKGAEREETCHGCNGRGSQPSQVFGGFILGEKQCRDCKGAKTIPVGNKCKVCNGSKKDTESKVIELLINKGIEDQECITFENMGDEMKDCKNGDLVFQITIKENERFERIGMDLIGTIELDLVKALTGGVIYFKHIDDRMLEINIGKVKSFKDAIVVKNEGFDNRGDLYLNVDYKIPKNIEKLKLEECFGALKEEKVKADVKIKGAYGHLPEKCEEEEDVRGGTFSQFFFG